MDKPMPNIMFNGMSFLLRLRDLLLPRERILKEAGIKSGDRVLDYGCGPGGYVAGTAELVGASGKVYALDIHPLAVQRIQDLARRRRLTNVETILSDCDTGLPDDSMDVVLLHDIFHMLSEPEAILAELHRVLKPDGTLSLSDHHMGEEDIIVGVTGGALFKLSRKGEHGYSFSPRVNGGLG
jgi:ubiquinone/menaquinone biosynthesis C-methylase UbiE